MPFIAPITKMWSKLREERQKAEWHRQALAGELGPSAKQEAEAWEWAIEAAMTVALSVAQVKAMLERANGDRKAALAYAELLSQSGMYFWPEASPPNYHALARMDAKAGRYK